MPTWYYRFSGALVASWPMEAPAWCISYDDYDYSGGAYDYGQCAAYHDRYWRPNPLLFPLGNW